MAGATRLNAPNPQAWATSSLENQLAAGLSGDNAPQVAPYFLAAQMGRMGNADSYTLALQRANEMAMREGQAEREKDILEARYKLTGTLAEHPDNAATFALSSQEVRDPARGQTLQQNYDLNQRAQAINKMGTGMNALSEAGLQMPIGTQFDASVGPTAPFTQGVARDIQQANISAGATLGSARISAGSAAAGRVSAAQLQANRFAHDFEMLGARADYQLSNGMQLAEGRAALRAEGPQNPAQIANAVSGARRAFTNQIRPDLEFNTQSRAAKVAEIDRRVAEFEAGLRSRGSAPPATSQTDAAVGSAPPPTTSAPSVSSAPAAPTVGATVAIKERLARQYNVPAAAITLGNNGTMARYIDPATSRPVVVRVQ